MSSQPQSRLRPFQAAPFGPYTLVSPLATGGMGELFLATQDGSSAACVIKKILPHLAAGPDLLQRFIHEAKALAQLSHESIARVLDMGIEEDRPYLVLEYVDGKDLRKVAARCRERQELLPPAITLYVMSRVLDALAYAHGLRDEGGREIQLVHRDVSPPNILISYGGEVKVIDFGLAKSTMRSANTHPSLLLGKFLYMSPEQARHQPVDRRSDLYSVGVCLYELLMGENPFDGLAPAEMMAEVSNPTFLGRHPIEQKLPERLAALVRRSLAVDLRHRFPTAEAFRDELLACLSELGTNGGPQAVSQWMRKAFAPEFGAERRLLAAALQTRDGNADTGYHVSNRPTPDSAAIAARPTPGAEVVALSFAPVPRTHEPETPGPQTEAPTSPSVRYGEAETQPEVELEAAPTPVDLHAVEPPKAVTLTPKKGWEQKISTVAPKRRSPAWLLLPVLVLLCALGVFLSWDLYRTGFFHSGARPADSRSAWYRDEPLDLDEDELAPLVTLGPGSQNAALRVSSRHFQDKLAHFKSRGCQGTRRAPLCRRGEALLAEVKAALEKGGSGGDEILGRIRDLGRELDDVVSGD